MRVAVIPARGGSKRIPRKNVRLFCGRPIIAYSVETALQCGIFDRVLVSTDDPEIAEISKAAGAEVPFLRPAQLSDDYTGTNAVVKHGIEALAQTGCLVEFACCIYATAPFLGPFHVLEGYRRLYGNPEKMFAFSVTSFPFPIHRAIRIVNDGMEPIWPENSTRRSQDLPEAFHDAGQFYWGRASAFIRGLPLFAPHSLPVVLPRWQVQDIDTFEDWERAERMFEAWGPEARGPRIEETHT